MNELKEKYHKLLQEFCGNDKFREILHHPFYDGVDVCATDTHWLMRVKPEAYGDELPQFGLKRIDVELLPKKLALPIERLVKAFLSCHLEDEIEEISPAVECKECGGCGVVEWVYESKDRYDFHDYFDCPICKGTGNEREAVTRKTGKKVPKQLIDSIAINGVLFDALRLFYIVEACHELGIDTLHITALGKPGKAVPTIFQLNDDCEIVLMPLNSNGEITINLTAKEV